MEKIITILICCLMVNIVLGQQEQEYTQFMHNKQAYNPGYAGSKGVPCFTAIYRSQWIGLTGAPRTQVLNFSSLLTGRRVGLGINFNRNTIGVTERWTLDGIYTYHIKLGKADLSFGMQASVRYYGVDFTDSRLVSSIPLLADGAVEIGAQSKYLPNFGVGAYLSTDYFFVGISLPRLLENDLGFIESNVVLSTEARHTYFMGGFLFPLGEFTQISPQALVQFVPNAPLDVGLNISLIFVESITVGGTFSLGGSSVNGSGESISLLGAVRLNKRMLFGLSYDFTLSEIKDYSRGSIEGLLQYCLIKPRVKEFVNPRFF